jgi:hypothetical protein
VRGNKALIKETKNAMVMGYIIGQAFDIYLKMHSQQYAAEQRWTGMPFGRDGRFSELLRHLPAGGD